MLDEIWFLQTSIIYHINLTALYMKVLRTPMSSVDIWLSHFYDGSFTVCTIKNVFARVMVWVLYLAISCRCHFWFNPPKLL